MGTKSVRLEESVYERIKAHKQEEESFSEVIDRLTSEYSLLDFAGGYSETAADRHRELLEQSETAGETDRQARLEQMGINTE